MCKHTPSCVRVVSTHSAPRLPRWPRDLAVVLARSVLHAAAAATRLPSTARRPMRCGQTSRSSCSAPSSLAPSVFPCAAVRVRAGGGFLLRAPCRTPVTDTVTDTDTRRPRPPPTRTQACIFQSPVPAECTPLTHCRFFPEQSLTRPLTHSRCGETCRLVPVPVGQARIARGYAGVAWVRVQLPLSYSLRGCGAVRAQQMATWSQICCCSCLASWRQHSGSMRAPSGRCCEIVKQARLRPRCLCAAQRARQPSVSVGVAARVWR
jgi:hypothetical protein